MIKNFKEFINEDIEQDETPEEEFIDPFTTNDFEEQMRDLRVQGIDITTLYNHIRRLRDEVGILPDTLFTRQPENPEEIDRMHDELEDDDHGLQDDIDRVYYNSGSEEKEESEDDWLMENIQTYEGFNEQGGVLDEIMKAIKSNFNIDDLSFNTDDGDEVYIYNHNDMLIEFRREFAWFNYGAMHNYSYSISVDNEKLKVIFVKAIRAFNFVRKKWKGKLKEERDFKSNSILSRI